jgi:hypothetical protein
MARIKLSSSGRGPISTKVLAGLKKSLNEKVVDFSELKNAKIYAENLSKSIVSQNKLADYDPLHGVYIYAQNMISVLVEQICELEAALKLNNAYADAQDLYLPSGPPMSPLTTSYFTCWGLFDLCVGMGKETFGTISMDLCRTLGVDEGLMKIFEYMQNSRMGLYIHEGVFERYVYLREITTQERIKAIVPSGYMGNAGEIWFVRLMPEPFPELNYGYSVVFTTPYIILEMENGGFYPSSEKSWLLFFERNLHKTGLKESKRAYDSLMKYGLNRHYWNEYIFEGYVNYKPDMILLAGFPDISLSRPHSKGSQEKAGY